MQVDSINSSCIHGNRPWECLQCAKAVLEKLKKQNALLQLNGKGLKKQLDESRDDLTAAKEMLQKEPRDSRSIIERCIHLNEEVITARKGLEDLANDSGAEIGKLTRALAVWDASAKWCQDITMPLSISENQSKGSLFETCKRLINWLNQIDAELTTHTEGEAKIKESIRDDIIDGEIHERKLNRKEAMKKTLYELWRENPIKRLKRERRNERIKWFVFGVAATYFAGHIIVALLKWKEVI